ncbi:MAG: type IV pilus assembly protein PilM [bacterium]|nr:type IV pilus assembly protein PilM [bacterium]
MAFFKKQKDFLAIDIGASSIKLMELDCRGAKPYLLNASITPLPGNVFSNNQISKKEIVADKIRTALANHDRNDINIVVAMPAPSVFTKRVSMSNIDAKELAATVRFEAGSYIPQGTDSVKLDFCITSRKPTGEIEVLVIAVKNEIVDSFLETINMAGFDTGIVDVDYLALQNSFEACYPEMYETPTCLVHVGSRYSFINICKSGVSLFSGNISLGGMNITQEIAKTMGIDPKDAETLKLEMEQGKAADEKIVAIVDKTRRSLVSDLDRQIRIMWNASGAEGELAQIMLSGGGALLPNLVSDLSSASGLKCELLDPFRFIEVGDEFDREYIQKLSPSMSIAAGMALRHFGDKQECGNAA